eukprot:NODE_95_length_21460_cov_0.300220.p4 type:complete len:430 gc:universal NODE_95_length_21460_cov_0.300220:12114-10825(-)
MIFSNAHGSILWPSLHKLPKSIVFNQYNLHENHLYFNEQLIFTLPEGLDCYLINDDYIILFSKDLIHVYVNDKHPKLLNAYKTSNPELIAINKDYLACCGYLTGQLYLIHLKSNQIHMIQAHSHDVSYIVLSNKYLASTSVQGTIIRIFNTETRKLFQEYRRGLEKANILCMSFSDDDKLLGLISDKYTIHVFVLTEPKDDLTIPIQLDAHSIDMSMQSLSLEDDDMISVEFSNSSVYSSSAPSTSYLPKSNKRKMKGLSRLLSTLDYDYSDYSIKLPRSLTSRLDEHKDKEGYVQPENGGRKTRLHCEFRPFYNTASLMIYTFLGDVIRYGFKSQSSSSNSFYDHQLNSESSSYSTDNSIIQEIVDIDEDYGKNMHRLEWHIIRLPGIDMDTPLVVKDLDDFIFQASPIQDLSQGVDSKEDDEDFVFT